VPVFERTKDGTTAVCAIDALFYGLEGGIDDLQIRPFVALPIVDNLPAACGSYIG
jgi:hypothetical protein